MYIYIFVGYIYIYNSISVLFLFSRFALLFPLIFLHCCLFFQSLSFNELTVFFILLLHRRFGHFSFWYLSLESLPLSVVNMLA